MARTSRATFTFIFIAVALDMLALGVIVPVLPNLVVELEGGDRARAASVTGIFGFGWAAMQFFASPILGMVSDRYGRRPVILLSCLGLGLDYVLMALAPSLAWLFVGRLVSGITSASYPTAAAYIADVTPPEERAEKFGMLAAAFGLGFVIGPAVGGFLGAIDLRLPFWGAAALSLLNAAYGFFVLPESLAPEHRTSFTWRKANPVGAIGLLKKTPLLAWLTVVVFLQGLAHESLPNAFVLYAGHRFAWSEDMVGYALAAVGIATTVMAAAVTGPLTRWLGERAAVIVGLVFAAAGMALFGLASSGWMIFLAIAVDAPSGIAGPALQSMFSREAGDDEQGQLQGAIGSVHGVTGMLGPILFTQVLAWAIDADRGHAPTAVAGAPFLLAAGLMALATIVAAYAAGRAKTGGDPGNDGGDSRGPAPVV